MNCLNEPSGKFVGYDYPEPLGSLIGEFEQQMLRRRVARNTPKDFSKSLWKFFSRFPKRRDPSQFHVTDVEDYREIRLAQGLAWNTVRKELGHVGTFFNWLRREKGLDIPCPVIWLPPAVRSLASERIAASRRPGRT